MSNELRTTFQGGGATLYAVIRKLSDLTQVWNGTALETFVNASIANYDIALTDRGGDEYSADMPAAITAGDYRIGVYEQAGGTPAITDLRLASYELHWDGSAASTVSSITLSAYALTDLDSVKTYMGVSGSTYDTKITRIINGVSAEIERICGTRFKARNYRERCNGGRQRRLVLRNRPVQRVTRIAYGNATALAVSYSGSAIDATASVYDDPELPAAGGLRLVTIVAGGTETESNLSFASYPTASTLATAVAAVSGWSATVTKDVRCVELFPTGGEDAKSRTVALSYPDRRQSTYHVDGRLGTVEFDRNAFNQWQWPGEGCEYRTRFPRDFQGIIALYRAGYESIPDDVQDLANELVKERYMMSTTNTAADQITLGPYTIRFNAQQMQKVRDRLADFMDGTAFVGGSV
jgi:hypothetical protein